MAQAVHIDVLVQAMKMGAKVNVHALKTQMDVVAAKDLEYADPQAWKFSGSSSAAEFIGGNPEVDGTYDVAKLNKGMLYEVYYYITMKNTEVNKSTVQLTLELPNGMQVLTKTALTVEPGVWQAVSVGQFICKWKTGDIKFSFSGATGDTWKGLLVQCVVITPPF